MAYTQPRTWAVSEMVTADLLNEQIRDNLTALKDPPSDSYEANEASDFTTASATFTEISNTRCTITTTGGDILVHVHGTAAHSSPSYIMFDVGLDGTPQGGDDGVLRVRPNAAGQGGAVGFSFTRLLTGVAAGTHVLALFWKTGAATATLYAGAGTGSGADIHPQFWAREVS